MENELIQELRKYVDKVYGGETLTEEQYKQIYLSFHAGALVWFKMMLRVAEQNKTNPEAGAAEIGRIKEMLYSNCADYTNQSKTVN